jgi:hypothetical protein
MHYHLTLADQALRSGLHTVALACLGMALKDCPTDTREWSKIMLAIKMTKKAGRIIDHV